MKCFSKKALRCTALTTVMAFAVTVFGADMRYILPGTAYADENTEGTTVDENTNEVDSLIMTDCFDELNLYRWTRVNEKNYPMDDKWHPSLLMIDDGMTSISAVAPSDIWIGESAANIKGANRFGGSSGVDNFMNSCEYFWDSRNSYALTRSDACNGHTYDAKGNIITGSWREVYPNIANGDKFYTNSDMDCVYMKFDKLDEKKSTTGLDGSTAPRYTVRLSNGNGYRSDYCFYPEAGPVRTYDAKILSSGNETVDAAIDTSLTMFCPFYGIVSFLWNTIEEQFLTYQTTRLKVDTSDKTIAFQSRKSSARGTVWRMFNDSGSDVKHRIVNYGGFIASMPYIPTGNWESFKHYFSRFDDEHSDATWYIGEKLRFTTIRNNTVVDDGAILQIQNNSFINDNNEEDQVAGVMIPAGEVLTVNPGGILSIDGTLINNGTIINRGTIIVKKGGAITPFLTSGVKEKFGCGAIKCLGGDIIIQNGGAIYGGFVDGAGSIVDFHLDDGSTLINQGLLVFGSLRLGESSRVELYDGSRTYNSYYPVKQSTATLYKTVDTLEECEKEKQLLEQKGFYVTHKSVGGGIQYVNGEVKETSYRFEIYTSKLTPIEQNDLLTYSTPYFMSGDISKVTQLTKCFYNGDAENGIYIMDGIDEKKKPHLKVGENAYLPISGNSSYVYTEELGL